MIGGELPIQEVMHILAEISPGSTEPEATIEGTAARLVAEHGYAPEAAARTARAAFDKWVEAYEGGFS